MHYRRLLPLLSLLLLPTGVLAQDNPDRPALPDIAPREVEILGQLEISFPSLQRQPLIGFNPPPRVADIPANRRPYAADYKQEKTDFPPSPLNPPDPPLVSSLGGKEPINGEFETSAGRYFTRKVRARTSLPLSRRAAVYGALDYQGTDGHAPLEDVEEATSAYDVLDGEFGVRLGTASLAAALEADGFFDRYTLYGVPRGATMVPLEPYPDRSGKGLGVTARLFSQGTSSADYRFTVRYGGSRFETHAFEGEDPMASRFRKSEQRLDLTGALGLPLQGGGSLFAEAEFASAGYGAEGGLQDGVTTLDGGAGYRFFAGRNLSVSLGARFLGYNAEDPALVARLGRNKRAAYLSPDVRVELYPAQGLRLYVENAPSLEAPGLFDLFRRNPFLVPAPEMQPTVRTVDAQAGGNLYVGPVQLAARAGFRQMPNYGFFERADDVESLGYAQGLAAVRYAEARVLHAGGDVSLVLPAGLQATLGVTFRQGRLPDGDTIIPYFGPILSQALLSYAFSGSRGLVQLAAEYESARYRDRAQTRKIGDFFDLDLSASYNFTPALGLVGRIQNVSAGYLERWEHHPQASLVVMGGLRVRW